MLILLTARKEVKEALYMEKTSKDVRKVKRNMILVEVALGSASTPANNFISGIQMMMIVACHQIMRCIPPCCETDVAATNMASPNE